jgi:hypothetical protein
MNEEHTHVYCSGEPLVDEDEARAVLAEQDASPEEEGEESGDTHVH